MKALSGPFASARSFGDGLAPVINDGKACYIDRDGKIAFTVKFTAEDIEYPELSIGSLGVFHEGLAAVSARDGPFGSIGRVGFIDKSGEYVIKPSFFNTGDFSEGLAAVQVDNRWGYLDKSGQLVIKNAFPEFAHYFSGGLAEVDDPVRGAVMYVDTSGRFRFFNNPTNQRKYEVASIEPVGPPHFWLDLYSEPAGADVYLVPQFIWEFGGQGSLGNLKDLSDNQLLDYFHANDNFRVQESRTHVRTEVLEENYQGIFLRDGKLVKSFVRIHLGNNTATVHFASP